MAYGPSRFNPLIQGYLEQRYRYTRRIHSTIKESRLKEWAGPNYKEYQLMLSAQYRNLNTGQIVRKFESYSTNFQKYNSIVFKTMLNEAIDFAKRSLGRDKDREGYRDRRDNSWVLTRILSIKIKIYKYSK